MLLEGTIIRLILLGASAECRALAFLWVTNSHLGKHFKYLTRYRHDALEISPHFSAYLCDHAFPAGDGIYRVVDSLIADG